MPVTMGGLASGMDTDAIIKKLIQVEAQPIKQLEQRKRVYGMKKMALKKLSGKLKKLESEARNLYGFRANYDAKKAISSDTSVLTVNASNKAAPGETKVEVLQIASEHKISSDKLTKPTKLPSGKFIIEVNGKKSSFRFKGGSLKSLYELITEEAADLVEASYIKTSGSEYILTLTSKVPGKKGQIELSGNKNLLKKSGFINGERVNKENDRDLTYDRKFFSSYIGKSRPEGDDGSLSVSRDGKKVSLTGQLWQEYEVPLELDVEKGTVMVFDFSYKKETAERVPLKIEMGPEEEINVKGINLRSYNISRFRHLKREKKKKFDSLVGVGVVSMKGETREEKIYPLSSDSVKKQEIPIGRDFAGKKIVRMVYYCNRGKAEFSNTKFSTPETIKGKFEYKNVIAKAKNAKLRMDGVEVERDRNENLSDIIKGVSLNLKRKSKTPVEIKTLADVDKPIKSIDNFVKAYNDYIDFNRKITKAVKLDKPDPNKERSEEGGIFVGDMELVRLENSIKNTVNDAYPSRAEKPIKIISQIGLSTGKINASWESIKLGKLIVDKEKLKSEIIDNPEGVAMLFGSDTDGDNRVDNGMAFSLVKVLKPYVSFGKNIIKTKIEHQDDSIKIANDRITRLEDHLKKYEAKLRSKFGSMERSMSNSKAQQNWMKNQMGGGSSGKK